MKTSVNLSQFRDSFRTYGRNDNFSYQGLELLFDYLEQLESDIGEELELDVIALCCDYAESDFETIAQEYSIDFSECEDDDDKIQAVEEYLQEYTVILGRVGDSIIYAQF